MRSRTKIICTIGPAVSSPEKISQLIDAGMNVARLNFSHGTHEEHLAVIRSLNEAREKKKVPLAIMLDTKGPEIRLGAIEGDAMPLKPKQRLLLVKETCIGNAERISLTPPHVLDDLKEETALLFDDGYIQATVVKKSAAGVLIEIQNEGVIKSHKGVNIPHVHINLPAMTEQDILDIRFGCKQDVDLIAASFIRSKEHVLEIKKLLATEKKSDILVIAKIENSLGIENFDAILEAADGIMVARGDLGVELPLKEVPSLQKMMIRKSIAAGKPVVTATQMLESMIKNPRPTRAEVSDVANAIYDSTSAVMLSGETAVGKYPIETVTLMKAIVEEAEKHFDYPEFFAKEGRYDFPDISTSVSLASVKTAYSTQARAIFAFTCSGFTARKIAQFRPQMPIFALSANPKIYHQMAFYWGVIPVPPAACKNVHEAIHVVSHFVLEKRLLQKGDLVVATSGTPFGVCGSTNMMLVETLS